MTLRYLWQSKGSVASKELLDRLNYLYNAFHIFCYPRARLYNDFIEIVSMPRNEIDVCMIVGHNKSVRHLLEHISIEEKTVVIISCKLMAKLSTIPSLQGKQVFLSRKKTDFSSYLLAGSEYGFHFDLTCSELNLYNTPSSWSVLKRIQASFHPATNSYI